MIETGWFGIPGGARYATKTHITEDRRPLCKASIRRDAEFQMVANGVHLRSVECERCKALWQARRTDSATKR